MAKILVVDDEKIIRERMKSLLELEGYEVAIAENGTEGLKVFEEFRPQIAIVDIKMPGMDGIEVLKRIKAIDSYTEVFIVTGHGGIETAVLALREGAFDYVTKPIEFDELTISLNRALEKQKLRQDLNEHTQKLEEAHKQLKAQQVQLLQAAKLTAVGELGAGVAHEMNQPLMAMSTHMESLLMNEIVTGNQPLKEKLLKIKDQFVRLGTIVKRMHDYSGSRVEGFIQEDINRPVRDGVYLMGQQLKDHNIALSVNLQEGLAPINLDRYKIQDVAINFLVNARDAVDEKFNQNEGGSIAVISQKLKSGKGVLAGVIDNGIPIKSGTEANLFDPFFTTKAPGKGTGLGLSVCYTIVKNHNGVIGFTTLKDGRKIFYFVLPFDKNNNLAADSELSEELKAEWEAL